MNTINMWNEWNELMWNEWNELMRQEARHRFRALLEMVHNRELKIGIDRGQFKDIIIAESANNGATFGEYCPLCADIHEDSKSPFWLFVDTEVKPYKPALCGRCAATACRGLFAVVEALNQYYLNNPWLECGPEGAAS